jgi:transcriptional regulator with XRE-family HTH domain
MAENEAANGGSEELGRYVRQARESRGLSVRALAAAANVDATWLSRLEHGTYISPDPRSLWRLARALDIEVADLYLAAGYRDGRGLPEFGIYLRSKYDLPEDAIAQLSAHFDLINEKYHQQEGEDYAPDHHHTP